MNRKQTRRGQSLVEFAIILPAFLLLSSGAVDLGRVYYANVALVGAVEQGARVASRDFRTRDPEIRAAVAAEPDDSLHTAIRQEDVTITPATQRIRSSPVTVEATTEFRALSPVMTAIVGNGGVITLKASATMQVE